MSSSAIPEAPDPKMRAAPESFPLDGGGDMATVVTVVVEEEEEVCTVHSRLKKYDRVTGTNIRAAFRASTCGQVSGMRT